MVDKLPDTPDSSSFVQVNSSAIQKGIKWVVKNPKTLAIAGLSIFALGVILSARKANKAS